MYFPHSALGTEEGSEEGGGGHGASAANDRVGSEGNGRICDEGDGGEGGDDQGEGGRRCGLVGVVEGVVQA
jgi:hypothetical protein